MSDKKQRLSRLEKQANKSDDQIIVCWHVDEAECDCAAGDDVTLIKIRYTDDWRPFSATAS